MYFLSFFLLLSPLCSVYHSMWHLFPQSCFRVYNFRITYIYLTRPFCIYLSRAYIRIYVHEVIITMPTLYLHRSFSPLLCSARQYVITKLRYRMQASRARIILRYRTYLRSRDESTDCNGINSSAQNTFDNLNFTAARMGALIYSAGNIRTIHFGKW